MRQAPSNTTVHDVVVIGSGAGGGTVTKVLADLGISVLLIEAGPMLNIADFKEHMWPYNVPHRGAGAKGQAYTGGPTGFTYSATYGGAQLEGEPYTVAPGSDFSWFRSRMLGGRTNHYGRVTLRMADYDFKPKTTDGLGFDWPISYGDMAPYYDKAERFIGVTGSHRKGFAARPTASSTRRRRCARTTSWSSARARKTGHPRRRRRARRSRPWRATAAPRATTAASAAAAARTASNYASSYVQIFPAMETGRVKVLAERDGARAGHRRRAARSPPSRTSTRRRTGKTGALPHGRARGQRLRVRAAAAELEGPGTRAGARELVRQGRPLPDGHRRLRACRRRCPRSRACRTTTPTATASHLYVPWWMWDRHKELNFPRGYHIEIGGGYGMPGIGSFTGVVEPRSRATASR